MDESGFISFRCCHCHTEIEASPDMIGESTECPACGTRFVVPSGDSSADGVRRHSANEQDPERIEAMKRRTIRIELDDL